MNATEAVAAIERLVVLMDEAATEIDSRKWALHHARSESRQVAFFDGMHALAHRLRAANARPALSALAGMCVLDVETVRVLVGETTRRHINDPFHNIGDLVDCDSCAALAAAEAELRRVDVRDV